MLQLENLSENSEEPEVKDSLKINLINPSF